ncbi:hypothetical protein P4O66_002697 [Electrophorus voltai]|uniref:Reverse transcriptase domain-containing protein n=1 Tax=Electrophorus voltai TaxID=2609070 RepID=A0AAD9DQY6_9TELE|nr:hypothetical protein P4O66_002697 [Electrophorus voltai]
MDRTADSGKSRGSGVCVMVNNSWCNNANVATLASSCSPNLELLALKFRPFYLPREFTSVIINTVYIPPQANMDTALWELHEALTQFQAQHQDAALIVVGDFKSANLKRAVPNLYQHVTFPTRGRDTRPLLNPIQGQLQGTSLSNVCTDDVSEFTEAVVGFIGKLVDDTIPRITIKKFPNQKLWVDKTIHEALNSRTAAYNVGIINGNMDEYKDYGRSRNTGAHPSGLMSADESLANELNTFFARFKATSSSANANNANGVIGTANRAFAEPTIEQRPLIITESDVRSVQKGKYQKGGGTRRIIPSSFKCSTIAVPKKPRPSGLDDYCPVALTSVVMKCFEKLVRDFITSSLPASMAPLQFAYRHNRSTDDAIAHLLHTTLTHLDKGRGNYVKMLFLDYSSAFNTIIPSLLTTKLEDLGLHTSLCDWISNFLTNRPQSVWVGNCVSSTLTLSTGAPQGCVLSPLLYSLYNYDCTATSSSTIIVKFADDTVIMGLISDNDERAYLEEIKHLENWCQENNLLLKVSKTKELIVDCSKKQERHCQLVRISGTTVERVDSFRYLGVHISQDLSWSRHSNSLAKRACQCLYHLRRPRDFRLPSKVLRNFYTCTIESILMGNITVWFGNSTKQDRQALQRVVHSAECITHTELPDLQSIYYKRYQTKARRIVKDPTHPNNRLFSLLRSGNHFRSLMTKTERLKRSFFPQAIRALNQGN